MMRIGAHQRAEAETPIDEDEAEEAEGQGGERKERNMNRELSCRIIGKGIS